MHLQILLLRAIKESNEYKSFKVMIKDLMLTTEMSSSQTEYN